MQNPFVKGKAKKLVTERELSRFKLICERTNTDPNTGEIYLLKQALEKPAILIATRNFFERIAMDHEKCEGWNSGLILRHQDGERYKAKVWEPGHDVIAGWAETYPKGWKWHRSIVVPVEVYEKNIADDLLKIETIALVQLLREVYIHYQIYLYFEIDKAENEPINGDARDAKLPSDALVDLIDRLNPQKDHELSRRIQEYIAHLIVNSHGNSVEAICKRALDNTAGFTTAFRKWKNDYTQRFLEALTK
jgi:hypothetical protein